jgi:hypothetical protein
MSPRLRNKLLTSCIALVFSLALVGILIVLDAIAPQGTFGWLMKTIPLIAAVPAALFGYEAVCDWFYHRFILNENRRIKGDGPYSLKQPRSNSESQTLITQTSNKAVNLKPSKEPQRHRVAAATIPLGVRNVRAERRTAANELKRWIGQ